jgi:hypothetical protein
MRATPTKPPSAGAHQDVPTASSDDRATVLARGIKVALEEYLKGKRLLRVQVRHVHGGKTEGFLKIEGSNSERLLVDFRATSTPKGEIASLEIGGRKIPLAASATTRKAR